MTTRRQLMEEAHRHGLKARAHPTEASLCFLVCQACGYGDKPELAVKVEQFMREPFGCTSCGNDAPVEKVKK